MADGSMVANATWYISAGCAASAPAIPAWVARHARNEPASSFSAPGTIHPGPPASSADHHTTPRLLSRGGRKRRKSTCSPICDTRESITAPAAATDRNASPPPSLPAKCVHSDTAPGSARSTKANGSTLSAIHTGCVTRCSRPMNVTPCVTSGITTTAQTM